MRRRIARPYGQSTSAIRLGSMVLALVVLWALYHRLKDPATWQFFVEENAAAPSSLPETPTNEDVEQIVVGPNDLDEVEVANVQKMFEMVTDKTALKPREMDAYWRMLDWSHTEPFDQLKQRAKSDLAFTLLFEQPEKYRGKPIHLKLHVRRILMHEDAPKNSADIKNVYEAWGWTDECRPYYYCVVFTDPPVNLPIGKDVRVEVEFVGYFLKILKYTAFDNSRGAPLLFGRVKTIATPTVQSRTAVDTATIPLIVCGIVAIVCLGVWIGNRQKPRGNVIPLPLDLDATSFLADDNGDNPFRHLGDDSVQVTESKDK